MSTMFDTDRPLSPPPAYTPTAQAHEHSLGQGDSASVSFPASSSQSSPPASPLPQHSSQHAYLPSVTPHPGRPLLCGGKILVYPPNIGCDKCHMVGYKAGDPNNPCQKCWSKFGRPYSSAMRFSVENSLTVPPNYQKPLPLLIPPHQQHRYSNIPNSSGRRYEQQGNSSRSRIRSHLREHQPQSASTSTYPAFHPARPRNRLHSAPQIVASEDQFPQNPIYDAAYISTSGAWPTPLPPLHPDPHYVPPSQMASYQQMHLLSPTYGHSGLLNSGYLPCNDCNGVGYRNPGTIFAERCDICLGSGLCRPLH